MEKNLLVTSLILRNNFIDGIILINQKEEKSWREEDNKYQLEFISVKDTETLNFKYKF